MGSRRKSREAALQLLYQCEFEDCEAGTTVRGFWAARKTEAAVREYADWLVQGILSKRKDLDSLIQSVSKNWRVARMSLIDRNILRIAAYELQFGQRMAPAVVINEAIEIAKRYSGHEASQFVNGVLDGVRKAVEGRPGSPDPAEDKDVGKKGKRRAAK